MNAPNDEIWLATAHHVRSPNADLRPDPDDISLLVLHNISLPPGQFGGRFIEDLFLNRLDRKQHPYFDEIADLRVSSHVLIARDGRTVQFVALNHRAWHAGQSEFRGRCACNDFSIGIELEGTDDSPFTDAQYEVLTVLTLDIQQRFQAISPDRIVGHSDIAPGRKTDPGPAFDWARYRRLLAKGNRPMG